MPLLSATSASSLSTDQPERYTLIWSIAGFAVLVVIGMISAWTLRQVEISDLWVSHTYTVINASDDLVADLREAEISEQQYLLGGEGAFLAAYRKAASSVPVRFATLRRLTADNPNQQKRIDELERLTAMELSRLELSARQRKPAQPAGSEIGADGTIGRIRSLDDDLEAEEYRLLQQRGALRRARLRDGVAATIASTAIALVAFIVAPIQVRRAARERNAAQREKRESASIVQSLFQSAPLAIMIVDSGGRIMMANAEAERRFGFGAGELRDQPVECLLREPFSTTALLQRVHAPATLDPSPAGPLEGRGHSREGSEFDAEISVGSVQAGGCTLAVVFVSDISRRRANEKAIEEQRERLSHLAGRLMTVQDDERRRIARNLHDDLSQTLASIAMDLGRLAGRKFLDDAAAHLRPLQERAASAAEYVRNISHQLHPSILDDLGLETALDEFCREFQERYGIVTRFTSQNLPEHLPPEVTNCVYQIAGECLRNVSKHSHSASASVEIAAFNSTLLMTVADQGIGFTGQETGSSAGIGIAAMNERAHLAGGSLFIDSSPGKGTIVKLQVPLAGVEARGEQV